MIYKYLISFLLRYREIGARLRRGVLLFGPSGTGKTLLAKATAGESNASFLSCTASEFIEMYVGVGPKRVRDLFEKVKRNLIINKKFSGQEKCAMHNFH